MVQHQEKWGFSEREVPIVVCGSAGYLQKLPNSIIMILITATLRSYSS